MMKNQWLSIYSFILHICRSFCFHQEMCLTFVDGLEFRQFTLDGLFDCDDFFGCQQLYFHIKIFVHAAVVSFCYDLIYLLLIFCNFRGLFCDVLITIIVFRRGSWTRQKLKKNSIEQSRSPMIRSELTLIMCRPLVNPSTWPSPHWFTDCVSLPRRLLLFARDRLSAVVDVALQLYMSPWGVLEHGLHTFLQYSANIWLSGTHPDTIFSRRAAVDAHSEFVDQVCRVFKPYKMSKCGLQGTERLAVCRQRVLCDRTLCPQAYHLILYAHQSWLADTAMLETVQVLISVMLWAEATFFLDTLCANNIPTPVSSILDRPRLLFVLWSQGRET